LSTSAEAVQANDQGKSLIRLGRRDEAMTHFARAVELDPAFAEAHNNLAILLGGNRRYDEAVAAYRRAIVLNPAYIEAHYNLGNTCRRMADAAGAIASYETALRLRPDFAEAQNGLGNAFLDLDRYGEAIDAFRKVIALQPKAIVAYNNLAIALRKTGDTAGALQALDGAIALKPDYALAHSNRGTLLADLGRHDDALEAMTRALKLQPDSESMLSSLVRLLRDLGRAHEAIAICRRLVDAVPTRADAFSTLAGLLQEVGEVDAAHAACVKALALNPDLAEAHNNLGNVLRDQGRLDEAIESYRRALELKPGAANFRSNLVFSVQFASGRGPDAILEEARRWAELHETPLLASVTRHVNDRSADRPLRVGYVSPYFRLHSAAFFLLPVLSHHDPGRVQVVCYSGARQGDTITERFKALGHTWRDVAGLSDAELADQVRADGIDILVDTALHMEGARLLAFARKPAPVQLTWLGYPGTTGLRSIDYRLTDPYLDPVGGGDAFYSERSVRLPRTFWCYAPLGPTPDVSTLPALEAGHVTFGCFNNFYKVTRETLDLWCAVLRAVPNSVLIILSQPGEHRRVIGEVFAQSGVAPDRIRFVGRLPLEDYLRLYNTVDLCLDTTPYPGHTTTIDGLWMGVPVVTLAGNTAVSRGGVSILSNMDLQGLIARDRESYVDIAAVVAQDLDALAALRASLRERLRASPLMNARQFSIDLEQAYVQMWSGYGGAS
jgi:protein O-GlcNAc transferase